MDEILEILEKDGRRPTAEIAALAGRSEAETAAAIAAYEADGVITGYAALVNWEKTDSERVTALIEVKVTPQRDRGFDQVAKRIYGYPEVKACYLMSGGFDLTVVIEGRSMKEVALFVAEKLATIDSVNSTATHFILKKYKDNGVVFGLRRNDDREQVLL
ncbi:MAG: Lrp/AsnC family transcriptional regulator [Planctomycetota bacterium]|jgi:DNA-binding Lrp family transcriptional regulator|nr:Lrp/AsnC family transcriptional regulator [Planctomycetota bacterium]